MRSWRTFATPLQRGWPGEAHSLTRGLRTGVALPRTCIKTAASTSPCTSLLRQQLPCTALPSTRGFASSADNQTTLPPSAETVEAPGENTQVEEDEEPQQEEAHPQDERTRLLVAALTNVPRLGWSADALRAGAADIGLSSAAIGMLARGEAELIQHFEEECTTQVARELAQQQEHLSDLPIRERLAFGVRLRLEKIVPYLRSWPQALSIQAQPPNALEALRVRAILMDELWFAAGDRSSDMSWYTKRAMLGAVYTSTELFMMTDTSAEHKDTWAFLERRLEEVMEAGTHVDHAAEHAAGLASSLGAQISSFAQAAAQRRYP